MKLRLSSIVLVASLAACQKSGGDPAPTAAAAAQVKAPPASQPSSKPASQPGNPHGDQAPAKFAGGDPFAGLLSLADGLTQADVNAKDVLFIMARQSQGGGRAGRLIAVKKVADAKFPLRFEIGPEDLMMVGTPFQGPFVVHARLDRDGNPMTRGEDDLYGTFAAEVNTGQKEVNMVMKKGAPQAVTPDGKTIKKPSSPH